ncbi:MAG: hypothetical protein CM15mP122_5780 [Bacteroidota bacterium]|nr:MAG: hypothetical protein CM15mP122_5780 [Bacteroidota bacterium]
MVMVHQMVLCLYRIKPAFCYKSVGARNWILFDSTRDHFNLVDEYIYSNQPQQKLNHQQMARIFGTIVLTNT